MSRDESSTKPKTIGLILLPLRAGDGIRSQASEKEEVDEDDEAAASFIWCLGISFIPFLYNNKTPGHLAPENTLLAKKKERNHLNQPINIAGTIYP